MLLATYAGMYLGTRGKKNTCPHVIEIQVLQMRSWVVCCSTTCTMRVFSVPFHLLRLTESAGIMVYTPHHCDLNLALLRESTRLRCNFKKDFVRIFVLSLNVNVFSLPISVFSFGKTKKGRC